MAVKPIDGAAYTAVQARRAKMPRTPVKPVAPRKSVRDQPQPVQARAVARPRKPVVSAGTMGGRPGVSSVPPQRGTLPPKTVGTGPNPVAPPVPVNAPPANIAGPAWLRRRPGPPGLKRPM